MQLAVVHNETHALENKELHARLCLADAQRLPMPLERQGVQKYLHTHSALTTLKAQTAMACSAQTDCDDKSPSACITPCPQAAESCTQYLPSALFSLTPGVTKTQFRCRPAGKTASGCL